MDTEDTLQHAHKILLGFGSFARLHQYDSRKVMGSILEAHDIEEMQHPLNSKFCGCLSIIEGVWVLGLNANHPERKQNFTRAHEVGHYFMHSQKNTQFIDDYKSLGSNAIVEQEANLFASEIMAPENVLDEMLTRQFSFYRIGNLLGMSWDALYWRLVRHVRTTLGRTNGEAQHIVKEYKDLSDNTIKRAQDSFLLRIFRPKHFHIRASQQVAATSSYFF